MPKPKVLVTTRLPGHMEKLFADKFEVQVFEGDELPRAKLLEYCKDKDAIVSDLVNVIDEEFLEHCPNVKVVANVAVGYDNIDIEAATKRNVLACNTPGVLTDTTADLAFALLMATARRLPEAERYLRTGQWKSFALDLLLGVDVHHKTLGIIGFGRIGQAFAARAAGFSMRIVYTQRNRASTEIENKYGARYLPLDELLQQSDFVSIHCPLNENTKGLIGKEQLSLMKETAFLINTARGAVVNEKDLVEVLRARKIAGAGLDVFSNEPHVAEEYLDMENVVLLPHIGSASIETRSEMARLAVQAVIKSFSKEEPHNIINKQCWSAFLSKLSEAALT